MTLLKVLAHNLRQERKRAGLTQEALAWKAKLHPNFVGRVERAENTISITNLERIAKVLKVEPYMLLMPPKELR